MTTEPVRPRTQRFIIIIMAVFAVLIGYLAGNRFSAPEPLDLKTGTALPEPRILPEFELIDQNGNAFTRDSLSDQWHFLFFGYTHCPDVCPTALLRFTQVYNRLGAYPELQGKTKMTMVSVDPARDTPEQMKNYVTYFSPEFVGLTGSKEMIDKLGTSLSVVYKIHEPEPGREGYVVDHSSTTMVINPDGRLAAVFTGETDPALIAGDFIELAKRYDGEL